MEHIIRDMLGHVIRASDEQSDKDRRVRARLKRWARANNIRERAARINQTEKESPIHTD